MAAAGWMRFKSMVWLAWLVLIVCVLGPYFWWEVEYFHSPGPKFHIALVCLIPVYVAGCAAYLRLRRKRWWRFEVPALVLFVSASLLFYQPLASVVSALLFLSCIATGCRIARAVRVPLRSEIETIGVGFALGSTALILALFLLGVAHWYFRPIFIVLIGLPLLAFGQEAIAAVAALKRLFCAAARCPALRHPMAGIAVQFAFLGLACSLAVLLSPSIAFDPLGMHLPAARQYAEQHRLEPLASLDYSYFPQGFEVVMSLAWSLGGQPAAQMISPLFYAQFLLMLFAIARTLKLDNVAAFAGVVCAGLLPVSHWTGSNAKNDMAMCFFEAAALYAFLQWLERRERVWIPIGAVFLGAAFGIKHVALFAAVPLGSYFLYAILRSRRRMRLTVVFGLLLAGSGLYWQAREWLLTGNPVYPAQVRQSVESGIPRPGRTPLERMARYCEILWQTHFAGQHTMESPLPNPAGIALLAFLPFAVLTARRSNPGRRACLWFSAAYIAYWVVAVGVLRYALLPPSLLILLVVGKARQFRDEAGYRAIRVSVNAAFAGVLLFAVLGVAIIELNAPMLGLLSRRTGWETYLKSTLPAYRSLAWLDRNRVDSNILAVDNFSRAYAPNPGRYYTTEAADPHIMQTAAACACQYVIVPADVDASRERQRFGFSGAARAVYRDAAFSIYQLLPD
jgi:hypothetical protein